MTYSDTVREIYKGCFKKNKGGVFVMKKALRIAALVVAAVVAFIIFRAVVIWMF